MDESLKLSEIAKLIASPVRAAMLLAMADGRALPASELAFRSGVTNQTASEHLSLMLKMGIVSIEPCGRHRYYRVVSRKLMDTLEDLLLSSSFIQPGERPDMDRIAPLREARMCYDHIAGRLGVSLAESFQEKGWINLVDRDFTVTGKGRLQLSRTLGLEWVSLESARRLFARRCIDWSERKPHIGGALGAALAQRMLEKDWIRRSKESRTVFTTREGRKILLELFDVAF